jgi:hypothetical protein
LNGLVLRHGGALSHIFRPPHNLSADEARVIRKVVVHAHIYNHDIGAGVAGEDVYARAAAEEVVDHLHRHFLREEGDTFVHDPVVAGKDEYRFLPEEGRHRVPRYGDDPPRELLEPSQTPWGFVRLSRRSCARPKRAPSAV